MEFLVEVKQLVTIQGANITQVKQQILVIG